MRGFKLFYTPYPPFEQDLMRNFVLFAVESAMNVGRGYLGNDLAKTLGCRLADQE